MRKCELWAEQGRSEAGWRLSEVILKGAWGDMDDVLVQKGAPSRDWRREREEMERSITAVGTKVLWRALHSASLPNNKQRDVNRSRDQRCSSKQRTESQQVKKKWRTKAKVGWRNTLSSSYTHFCLDCQPSPNPNQEQVANSGAPACFVRYRRQWPLACE